MSFSLKRPVSSLYIFCWTIFFLWMSVSPLPAEELPEETKATLKMLINAHADKNEQTSGKAVVLVEISGRNGYPKIIEFMFKDKWTRRDIYSVTNGKKDQRETVWVKGQNGTIHYEQSESIAFIDENSMALDSSNYRKQSKFKLKFISYYAGFYPSHVFLNLEALLKRRNINITCSTMTDDDGMLHVVIVDHWNEFGSPYLALSFDATNDYLLSRAINVWEKQYEFERNSSQFIDFEWSKIPSYQYVSSVKSIYYKGLYKTQEEAVSANAEIEDSREITFLEYDPLAEIDDSDFELEGLDLPVNTRMQNIDTGED